MDRIRIQENSIQYLRHCSVFITLQIFSLFSDGDNWQNNLLILSAFAIMLPSNLYLVFCHQENPYLRLLVIALNKIVLLLLIILKIQIFYGDDSFLQLQMLTLGEYFGNVVTSNQFPTTSQRILQYHSFEKFLIVVVILLSLLLSPERIMNTKGMAFLAIYCLLLNFENGFTYYVSLRRFKQMKHSTETITKSKSQFLNHGFDHIEGDCVNPLEYLSKSGPESQKIEFPLLYFASSSPKNSTVKPSTFQQFHRNPMLQSNDVSDQLFKKICNSIPDGISLIDSQKNVTFVSSSLILQMGERNKSKALEKVIMLQNAQQFPQESENEIFENLLQNNSYTPEILGDDDIDLQNNSYRYVGSAGRNEESKDDDELRSFSNLYEKSFSNLPNVKSLIDKIFHDMSRRRAGIDAFDEVSDSQRDNICFEDEQKMICKYERRDEMPNERNRSSTVTLHKGRFFFQVTFKPFRWSRSDFCLLVVRDVTFFNHISILKQVNQNQSKMLAQVAHEFRTPLSTVLLSAESLIHKSDTHTVEQYLTPIIISSKQVLNLVNDLLDAAQVKAGKFELVRKHFDLFALVQEVFSSMKVQCRQKGLNLTFFVEDGIREMRFKSDPNRIRQVLYNLLGNALKFTTKGSISVDAHIIKQFNCVFVSDQILEISVTDTGLGIRQEDQPKLFKQFSKLDDPNSYNTQGVGLGLMISNVLAKKLSKSPTESEAQGLKVFSGGIGKGTMFTFRVYNHASQGTQSQRSLIEITQPIIQTQQPTQHPLKLAPNLRSQSYKLLRFGVQPRLSRSVKNKDEYVADAEYKEAEERVHVRAFTTSKQKAQRQKYNFTNCECPDILFVDDDPFILQATIGLFDRCKLKFDTAYSGEEALEKILTFKGCENCSNYKLLITDLIMGGMDGIALTKQCHRFQPITVVGVSGASEMEQEACMKAGMKMCFQKPISRALFLSFLEKEIRLWTQTHFSGK